MNTQNWGLEQSALLLILYRIFIRFFLVATPIHIPTVLLPHPFSPLSSPSLVSCLLDQWGRFFLEERRGTTRAIWNMRIADSGSHQCMQAPRPAGSFSRLFQGPVHRWCQSSMSKPLVILICIYKTRDNKPFMCLLGIYLSFSGEVAYSDAVLIF